MFRNYVIIAWRNLIKHKGFSLLNICGLAVGITAGFLILLYCNFEFSYDSFHTKGDRIFRMVSDIKTPSGTHKNNGPAWAVSPNLQQDFDEVEESVRVLDFPNLVVEKGAVQHQEQNAILADAGFFRVFDFKLLQGNAETALSAPFSLVLSKSAAKRYFGDENPVGKSIKVLDEGFEAQITGLMEDIPENSTVQADMLLSMATMTQNLQKELNEQWGWYAPQTYVLLTSESNRENLEGKLPKFLKDHGQNKEGAEDFVTLLLEPLEEVYLYSEREAMISGNITNVFVFGLIGLMILLIAGINFVNLTTARSVERAKEVGVRKVIGAERHNLRFQFIGETLIVSLLSFLLATGLTIVALPYFNSIAGKTISRGLFSEPVLFLILLGVALLLGLVAGLYPAFILSSYNPKNVLKGRVSPGARGTRLRKGLVVVQFTISILMIIGTIIIYNQIDFMLNHGLGFEKEQIVALTLRNAAAHESFREALEGLPGVSSTSMASNVPGGRNSYAASKLENSNGDMQAEGIALTFVDYGFASQFGLQFLAGRMFSRDFASDSTEAMIINERAAEFLGYASPENAIGAKFEQWGRRGQIIGVVKDFHFKSLQTQIAPLTMRIEPDEYSLITVELSAGDVMQTMAAIKGEWESFLPDMPFDYFFVDEFFDRQYRSEQRFGKLFLNFALLAIFISCIGLLGLAAFSTVQRRREIGIRKVMGASVATIINLLTKEFLMLVCIAFLIASPVAWWLMDSWLEAFAYKINISWQPFVLAWISASAIAILSVSLIAVKAATANPVKSLRTE